MRDEMKKVPRLRFRGFSEDWELCKLKEITERVKGNDGRMDLPTLTISASQGWLNQKDRFSGNIAGKEQKNYTLLLKNELSYNHGNSKLAKYGAVFSLKTYEEALVPRVYHSFKSTKNSDPDFLEYIFATKKPDKELGKLVSSGARMDGLLNINYDDFSNIKINIPHVHEQKKISNLLRKIDDIITLHQRKLDQLKELKKAYLQLMFVSMNTKNNKVPKLRFADFEGDWKQRKLGDFLEDFSKKSTIENEYIILSSTNNGMEIREGRVSGNSNLGYKIIDDGDLVLSPQNLWLGNININNIGQGLVSPSYKTFKIIDLNKEFLNPQLRTNKMLDQYKNASTQGASIVRRNLELDLFYQIRIFIPKNEEQKQIGLLFRKLNESISLHQSKLDSIKYLKKAYLQNMFI
ncbi:TPA: restriction endonuclease subunit S [Enterococcus faecalis]|uniref:restriction endonuclease subunit S n=2 Tax=Enterococcus TaxID=1350 RepID=UPI0001CB2C64|nr:restriction endonuclease subunit S [Enterococcus faecalis]HAP3759155.1 restriction endonuclease subunit S [Enterococcus faecalis TDR7]HAP4962424.1 restriction endonuclease subunit S [Enterococcus faecalis ADL-336]EFE19157.1 type I restriction modification DNA specificity domain protein [Enterococcus faecalis S613]EFQ08795.1 type I restriction modification DNA specificity domain protein [Enterococcus faecalis DAPTO 512]EFQ69241.1 type I restriction modification DNA specificity domain protein